MRHRQKLENGRFSKKTQLAELIGRQNFEILADFVTTHSWTDPNTVKPRVFTEQVFRSDGSARKYSPLYGAHRPTIEPRAPVNINTAPRHVLEAAFMFGGDADKIAQEIIQQRRVMPFEDIKELEQSLYRYNDSIDKCKNFITTTSRFFTIRVRAVSGGAEAASVIAIIKDGNKVKRVAVINS